MASIHRSLWRFEFVRMWKGGHSLWYRHGAFAWRIAATRRPLVCFAQIREVVRYHAKGWR